MDEHTDGREHDQRWLGEQFEANRTHLRAVAYRMLGSLHEAEDAVQESWLRLSRADASAIENLSGWLTTVVARICLDMLRSREARREQPFAVDAPDPIMPQESGSDPEREALLAESVGLAMLVVLDTLDPAERLAFVLHDLFSVSFDEIANIVGRTPTAARQLASRARRRVRGATAPPDTDLAQQRVVVDAFFAASRAGNFDALLALLDPNVVARADHAVPVGALQVTRGATAVANQFLGRARAAQPALVNGTAGAVWASNGRPIVVFDFIIRQGKIVEINLLADRALLRQLDVTTVG
ncbi:MAG TPA: sigma-70 family RNA polymerase sigma factor [Ktedonobacterales bacterium]|nr:sigma-70 family RNA polymerase sigma factor [Ktedonobacterales bacterium]